MSSLNDIISVLIHTNNFVVDRLMFYRFLLSGQVVVNVGVCIISYSVCSARFEAISKQNDG